MTDPAPAAATPSPTSLSEAMALIQSERAAADPPLPPITNGAELQALASERFPTLTP